MGLRTALLAAGLILAAWTGAHAAPLTLPSSPLTDEQKIVHALNRLGYGPRPGDVEQVRGMGLGAWIERQLRPESVPDPAVEEKLKDLPTLAMSTADLMREYPRPDPRMVQKLRDGGMTRAELLELFPAEKRPGRIVGELAVAKLVRAVESERQLQEVMVDFWFNHFNVFAGKSAVRWMVTAYERDAIRPHALGRFEDLLLATARHPAMLVYLDNWMSVRGDLPARREGKGPRGLNENYARELLELHTLGVDGGYTQRDVVEVARCFTGWSVERPGEGGGFVFRARAHDDGEKTVLGHRLPPGGGQRDGERVIAILARHPSTARFIATKLVRRFVSDALPPALVARVADTFTRTDGDIRSLLTVIVTSPEFWSAEAYRAKVKKPVELVASAVRAVDGRVESGAPLARAVAQIGEPLYAFQPPTGYPDTADAWVSTGALVNRLNFAHSLAEGRVPGVRVDLRRLAGATEPADPEALLDRLLAGILHGEAAPATREALLSQAAESRDAGLETLTALVLGSPEFQRR